MDCATYRRLCPKYEKLPLPRKAWDTPEYEAHMEHSHKCEACGDWTLGQRVLARGAKIEDYPCVHIAEQVTRKLVSTESDAFDDPDVVIWKFESSGEYGIPIRDGGSSISVIEYCPWCGIHLYEKE